MSFAYRADTEAIAIYLLLGGGHVRLSARYRRKARCTGTSGLPPSMRCAA